MLRVRAGPVSSTVFSADGKLMLTGSGSSTTRGGVKDTVAKLWDAQTARELPVLKGHRRPVISVAISADGKRLLTGSEDRTVKLWDARTGREILTLGGFTGPVFSVAFSPDGRRIATASKDGVRCWDSR
jgi:WD40 repeat protein